LFLARLSRLAALARQLFPGDPVVLVRRLFPARLQCPAALVLRLRLEHHWCRPFHYRPSHPGPLENLARRLPLALHRCPSDLGLHHRPWHHEHLADPGRHLHRVFRCRLWDLEHPESLVRRLPPEFHRRPSDPGCHHRPWHHEHLADPGRHLHRVFRCRLWDLEHPESLVRRLPPEFHRRPSGPGCHHRPWLHGRLENLARPVRRLILALRPRPSDPERLVRRLIHPLLWHPERLATRL